MTLAMLQKILYTAKASRDLLERFYADPSATTLKNPALADAAHTLCPYILRHENYIRAIQEGLLCVSADDEEEWKKRALMFDRTNFNKIHKSYDELLAAIEGAAQAGDIDFDLSRLDEHDKFLAGYVEKNFAAFSPDKQRKDE